MVPAYPGCRVIRSTDLEWRFPPEAESASSARRRVLEALEDLDLDGASDSAALVVSELAANVLLHARSDFVVRLIVAQPEDGRPVLRIEVDDRSTHVPTIHNFTLVSTSGRGLRLVNSLSAAWGVELAAERSGKTVWAELEVDADSRAPAPFTSSRLSPDGFDFDGVEPL